MKKQNRLKGAKNGLKSKTKNIGERVAGLYKSGNTNFFTTFDFNLSGITKADMLKFIQDKYITVGGCVARGIIILSKDDRVLTGPEVSKL